MKLRYRRFIQNPFSDYRRGFPLQKGNFTWEYFLTSNFYSLFEGEMPEGQKGLISYFVVIVGLDDVFDFAGDVDDDGNDDKNTGATNS